MEVCTPVFSGDGAFAGKPRRLKPLGLHETPEVNTSVVSFTPTGVNVKLVHIRPLVGVWWYKKVDKVNISCPWRQKGVLAGTPFQRQRADIFQILI